MEALQQLLSAQGEMLFSAFVNQARAAGLRQELWLKAKHAGLIVAEIRDGVHYVRAAEPVEES